MGYLIVISLALLLLIWFIALRYYEARQRRSQLKRKRDLDAGQRDQAGEQDKVGKPGSDIYM